MYNYEIQDSNKYYFKTVTGVEYNVWFKPSPYVFGDDVIFASYVYELIIKLSANGRLV